VECGVRVKDEEAEKEKDFEHEDEEVRRVRP